MLAKLDTAISSDFTVTDEANDRVSGILPGAFTAHIYDPSGALIVPATVSFAITELGNGHYRVTYTPDSLGTWMVTVYHATYFPWGKAEDFLVYRYDISGIAAQVWEELEADHDTANTFGALVAFINAIEGGRWKIDETTNQMIFYKEDNTTEIARFNLKDIDGNAAYENVFERTRV